ncbi:MAG: glycosyltransferase [Mucilaginibacter sp.]|uniref:glycosyltransferase n=1 Tax=Mucilaginibacter sp. TaxID=1882438 RepID=UPI0032636932
MRNAIFLTFDDHYLKYAFVCLNSIKENYPNHPEILIFYEGQDAFVLKSIDAIPNCNIIQFNLEFLKEYNIKLTDWTTSKVLIRYILWTPQFDEYDNILHIDADTIICKPLDEIFSNTDFFAVKDYTPFGFSGFKKEFSSNKVLQKMLAADNFPFSPSECSMLNAGVFVIPKKYRTKAHFEKLLELSKKYSFYANFADQTIISLWCHYNLIDFSENLRFNFQMCFFNNLSFFRGISDFEEIISDIHICHFTWWKPESKMYKAFLISINCFQTINYQYEYYLNRNE